MSPRNHPWQHHVDGGRHYALCGRGCGLIVEWRQSSPTGVPSKTMDTIRRHVAKCEGGDGVFSDRWYAEREQ